jgi:hypothetical protein
MPSFYFLRKIEPFKSPHECIQMSKATRNKVFEYDCDPTMFDGKTKFPVTFFAPKITIVPPFQYKPAPTIGQEVDELIQEWYKARGQKIPDDEIGIGSKIDAATSAEEARITASYQKAEDELPSVAPSYGTPEFWEYHRKKKALENKRRADAGLPPLPTKKELEAEKEKRKAEREANKAAKTKGRTTLDELTEMVDNLTIV